MTRESYSIGWAAVLRLVQADFLIYGTSRQPAPEGTLILALDAYSGGRMQSSVDHVLHQPGTIDVLLDNITLSDHRAKAFVFELPETARYTKLAC